MLRRLRYRFALFGVMLNWIADAKPAGAHAGAAHAFESGGDLGSGLFGLIALVLAALVVYYWKRDRHGGDPRDDPRDETSAAALGERLVKRGEAAPRSGPRQRAAKPPARP